MHWCSGGMYIYLYFLLLRVDDKLIFIMDFITPRANIFSFLCEVLCGQNTDLPGWICGDKINRSNDPR